MRFPVPAAAVCAVVSLFPLCAADWLMFGGDPQRSGWARQEKKLTRESASKLKLEWSAKLESRPAELTSLTTPVIIEDVGTPKGFKDIVIVAGADSLVFAIDADTGRLMWKTRLVVEGEPKNKPHWLCPNTLNATPVIDKSAKTVYVLAADGRLHSLNVVNGEDRMPPVAFTPPYGKPWSLTLVNQVLYTATSQGCNGVRSAVYAMDLADPAHPVTRFPSGPTGGAGIWGRAGVAVSSQGRVFAETGDGAYDVAAGKFSDTILALTPKELKLADYYTPANRAWITKKDLDMGCISPVVFPFEGGELVAGAGKEGVIYLLDASSPGGPDHRVPLYRSPLLTNEEVDFAGRGFWGSFATWQDAGGVRWLYAPAWGPPVSGESGPKFSKTWGATPQGSIMAFRVEKKDGKPVLVPVWNSRDMDVPEPPVIANGVVFAIANGEYSRQVDEGGRLLTSEERKQKSGRTVLYAFDAATGQELYSSGDTMPGFTHFSGLALSNGRIYVVTHDAHIYAFGLGE